ncbi:hypothetical protein nbrc107697_14760 [Gordonia crocea]|uniref:Uncharacterized protein n=1 Tax=Gordonia crocea TaxID=589162 RepID=A0A7I9UW59_9ACTN|nr:hypothetical protein nbrc107697_14760 [Gordonia crocea]
MTEPLPKTTAAGPSFFSSYSEKYSNMARTCGERVASFSHAGGIIETIAVTRSTWSSVTRVATVWSRRELSDWPGGRTIVRRAAAAAVTWAMRFFRSVLSSPLWAR